MGWKDWNYWVKGGMILSLFTFLITLVSLIRGPINGWKSLGFFTYPIKYFLEEIILEPSGISGDIFYFTFPYSIAFFVILSIIFYFIIGCLICAIIGFIVGKIIKK